eukprot:UN22435
MTDCAATDSPMDLSPMDCSPAVSDGPGGIVEETIVEETNINTSIITIQRQKNQITKKKISKITKKKTSSKTKSFRKIKDPRKATAKKSGKKVSYPTPEPVASEDLSSENKYMLKKLRFRAWKCDSFVIDVLKRRGYELVGEPSDAGREDYPKSMKVEKLEGRLDMDDCLFWADDDDAKILQGMSNNHVISCMPGSDSSLTKVYQQTMFNDYEWFPTCWTLPAEKESLNKFIESNPESWYICKPKHSYGGFGMCVYKANSDEFKTLFNRKCPFVVQKYMHDPYLFAGLYKFHLRCYMVVTNARKPLKAYLYKDAQIQFSTHKFDLTQIEKKFNKYSHITNYKVNNEKKNMNYLLNDKPGIGKGSEWPIKKFFKYMSEHDDKWDTDKFWVELTEIATVVAEKISFHQWCRRILIRKDV